MKRFFVTVALTIASLAGVVAAERSGAARPNIVFIMADDLGYTDVACFGSKFYETPNIDRLAAQGMRLTSFHTAPNCQPRPRSSSARRNS